MTLEEYLLEQEEWSARTFGHGVRTVGITRHIEKELAEIRARPHDLSEWADVIILALDGYWRAGGDPQQIMECLATKQQENFARKWEPGSADEPTEHVREPLFYIQNVGTVGNCMRWWREGGHGYTSDLKRAWKVTRAEAVDICRCRPKEDFARAVSVMDAISEQHVDVQKTLDLDRAFANLPPCRHERLTEDGQCRTCGADRRGIGG